LSIDRSVPSTSEIDEEHPMETPIACTLTTDEYRSRTADLSALARLALRSREPMADGERLTFAASAAIEDELRAAIAAEARCCSFLTMELGGEGEDLVLYIRGPELARPVIAELFA
jgi:hypothetical protein